MLTASVLSVHQERDLIHAAEILVAGGVVALPFNGIWALFGDLQRPDVYDRIMTAKQRPADRRLAQVCLPENVAELVDFSRTSFAESNVHRLWRAVHGLGLILPAQPGVDAYLATVQPADGSVLLVWTEYAPLRRVLTHFRQFGGRALFGTSSNRSGLSTHITLREVWVDFSDQVDAVVADDFSYLPAHRRQSTSIVDLKGPRPTLRRRGSVSEPELQTALVRSGFARLAAPDSSTVGRLQLV